MKVLITGATGLIGQQLGIELVRQGYDLVVVSRNKSRAQLNLPFPAEVVEGDLMQGPLELPQDITAVIHLLGEGVADRRWSEEQKLQILDSRTKSSKNLLQSFKKMPALWVQASAIGFYGDRADESLDESSEKGSGFLSDVCLQWESAAEEALKKGALREVRARLGIVLSSQGGALAKMLTPFQAGVGGALGNGKQWMSWIHIRDAVRLFVECLKNENYKGVVNFVSPEPLTNYDFSKSLTQRLNRFMGPPVPELALKALFGEMAVVLLASQKVVPQQALKNGFQFEFDELQKAFTSVLPGGPKGEQYLETYQYIPFKREKVFSFFSKAENLEKITPDFLHFRITRSSTPQIQKGTEIDYRLKIHGFPAGWKTLIEEFESPRFFVDTALKSPYQKWHHTHIFEDLGPGTLVIDRVLYKLPVGYLGWLVGGALVKKDVNDIFNFRRSAVLKALHIV
ncbi:MAG: TIGR01777 family oxidoreductase [Bdellovibrionales bacterium]